MPAERPGNRLFFALWPDEATRAACAEAARVLRLRMQPRGAPSVAQRYHLTLLFLGDDVPEVAETAARQVASHVRARPFTLRLDHAGSFRNREVPWWLGSREPPPALSTLHERLREALLRARVPVQPMRFSPHLTIHRDAGAPLPPTLIQPIEWPVRDFVLIRSHIGRAPVVYEQVGCWPLDPDAPEAAAGGGQMRLL
ncbi:RNA 2',3'-cyclic phosphodiesterase [Sinimarinibacterium thermocellulolyticum]|uniref:RNA 2',3'-cyclic phosphodiesterase n=1 Tax=Sinimarinibacterium thermocellulolyticum TaxID=3170016 RepID=A0ABV2A5K4_9GAMM